MDIQTKHNKITPTKKTLYAVVSIFMIAECVLFFILQTVIDKSIIAISFLSQSFLLYGLMNHYYTLIQIMHIVFAIFMFFIIPFFSQSTLLLLLHVFTCMFTLALRAEYNGCPITKEEGSASKLYDSYLIHSINYNILYCLCGCVSLFRIAYRSYPLV